MARGRSHLPLNKRTSARMMNSLDELPPCEIVFSMRITLAEHHWVSSGERRRMSIARASAGVLERDSSVNKRQVRSRRYIYRPAM